MSEALSEQDFISQCEAILNAIEDAIDEAGIDADFERSGHVLDICFENDAHVVVNGQVPMREIWLASPSGAHHFRKVENQWRDTRSDDLFSASLSRAVSLHSGVQTILAFAGE